MHKRWHSRLAPGLLLVLLMHMAISALSFMPLRAFTGQPLRSCSLAKQQPQKKSHILSAMPKDTISWVDFVLGTNVDKAEVESLAASVAKATTDGLWDMCEFERLEKELPKYERFLDGVQFQQAARKLSPGVSDAAIQAVFMVLAKGRAGWIVKGAVDPVVADWSGGLDGSFDAGAFNFSWFASKANVAFAYWFLNIFAPFCSYFFFVRGPLKAYVGIDLLPGTPNFWERGPPPAAADAVQAAGQVLAAAAPV